MMAQLIMAFRCSRSGIPFNIVLEQAVSVLTGETVKVISSGRTDAGVHAKAQVINFTTNSKIPIDRWA